MDVLEAEARAGKTVIATTHDLICAAQRFHQAALINGRLIAQGPADLVLDQRLLAETYGGHVLDPARRRRTARPRRRPSPRRGAAASATSTTSTLMDPIAFLVDPMAYGFMQRGLVAALLVGVVCAVMGTFVVLKGLAFIGDAVSHAAFPGLVIAYIVGAPLYIGGAIAAVATALAIGLVSRRSRLRFDTAVGVLFAGTFAFGVMLFSTIKGYVTDLLGYLLGNVLGIGIGRPDPGRGARRDRPGHRPRDPQGAPVRDVRSPRRRRVGAAGGRARVPAAGAARGDDRGQHPGGRDHHGRRDAGDARRRRRSCWSSGSTG